MLVLLVAQIACGFFVDYRGHAMGAMMESDLRSELFAHYQNLSFPFYDGQKTGQLMSRITNDLFSLAELYHHGPEDIMIHTVKLIGAFIILININLKLTLGVFLFLPFMALYAVYFNKRMHAALKRNKERIADINAQVEDTLAGIRVVKSFANEGVERNKFAYENQRFPESRTDGYKNEAYFSQGIDAFIQLISIAVIVFGAAGILHASLDLADLITFLLYISNLVEPIQKFLHVAMQYQEGITGFERFMEVLQFEPESRDTPDLIELTHVQGRVEFKNVGFRYHQNRSDVLKNITLDVKAGETVALVGSSGVGKTTLCALIPRFYELSEGTIFLDGVDIRRIRLGSLRNKVGIVQQDVYLFADTVAENIRYGKPGAIEAMRVCVTCNLPLR
jgi:ATP-binding cassette subfamily B protein